MKICGKRKSSVGNGIKLMTKYNEWTGNEKYNACSVPAKKTGMSDNRYIK